jgi:hypothetical protein
LGYLEAEGKGGFYTRTGYEAFNGTGGLYRTIASRGWGGYTSATEGPLYNDLQCSLDYPFVTSPLSYYGFMLSQLWGGASSPIPWGTDTLLVAYGATPFAEIDDCADDPGMMDFFPEVEEVDRVLSYEGDGLNNPLGPRGISHLLNAIDNDDAFLELRDYVNALAWPGGTYARCWTNETCAANEVRVRYHAVWPLASVFIVHEAARYRRRFPIPASGIVRFEWDIYWTPEGGVAELYDTIVWEWDGTIPVGYDDADPDTWPDTGWFEMPPYDADLGYGAFSIAATDWRVECTTAAASTAPVSIEAEAA